MDELSEEDKLTVARARKIQRFLSQPFQVAEVFTGHLGKLVPLKETISGFKSILGGTSLFLALIWAQSSNCTFLKKLRGLHSDNAQGSFGTSCRPCTEVTSESLLNLNV